MSSSAAPDLACITLRSCSAERSHRSRPNVRAYLAAAPDSAGNNRRARAATSLRRSQLVQVSVCCVLCILGRLLGRLNTILTFISPERLALAGERARTSRRAALCCESFIIARACFVAWSWSCSRVRSYHLTNYLTWHQVTEPFSSALPHLRRVLAESNIEISPFVARWYRNRITASDLEEDIALALALSHSQHALFARSLRISHRCANK